MAVRLPDKFYTPGPGGQTMVDEPAQFLNDALLELTNILETGSTNIAGESNKRLAKTKGAMDEALAALNKPESGYHKYADPITKALASIAYIADISSGKHGRRVGAREKFSGIMGGIAGEKAQRKAEKKQTFSDALQQIGIEQGLDQQALDILMKEHQADVDRSKIKLGVAQQKSEQASMEKRTRMTTGAKGPSPDEVFTGKALSLFHSTNDPKVFRQKYPSLYSHLVAKKEISPIDEEDIFTGIMKSPFGQSIAEMMASGDMEGAGNLIKEILGFKSYTKAMQTGDWSEIMNMVADKQEKVNTAEQGLFGTDYGGFPGIQPRVSGPKAAPGEVDAMNELLQIFNQGR